MNNAQGNCETVDWEPQTNAREEELIFRTNVFSQPWKDSDVVLLVQDKEFHVHRAFLAVHSDVFKAMFNGDFKDATKDRIELKDDNYQAMLLFLKLFYPANLFDDDDGKVDINDENIVDILVLADKYVAVNIIKQCMKVTERLQPENVMRLLPYAARHKLPLEKILDIISRCVSTSKLASFASEQLSTSKNSVYDQCLVEKCRFLENVAKQANTMILLLLDEVVEKNNDADSKKPCSNSDVVAREVTTDLEPMLIVYPAVGPVVSTQCVLQHGHFSITEYKKARNCEHCIAAYKKDLIDKYVFLKSNKGVPQYAILNPYTQSFVSHSNTIQFQGSTFTSSDVTNLLELLNNI